MLASPQVLPANTSLVSLMLNGPVPKPVLSFIGAVLSSNALAHGSPAAVGSPPQRAAGTAAGERPGLGPARQQRAGQLEQAQPPANSTFAVSSGLQSRGGKRGASPGPGQAAAPAPALNRSLTVQARSAGAADPEGMRGLAAGGVSDKAAEVFRRHDTDCSGCAPGCGRRGGQPRGHVPHAEQDIVAGIRPFSTRSCSVHAGTLMSRR